MSDAATGITGPSGTAKVAGATLPAADGRRSQRVAMHVDR